MKAKKPPKTPKEETPIVDRTPITEDDRKHNSDIFTQFSNIKENIRDRGAPDSVAEELRALQGANRRAEKENTKLREEMRSLKKEQAELLSTLKELNRKLSS